MSVTSVATFKRMHISAAVRALESMNYSVYRKQCLTMTTHVIPAVIDTRIACAARRPTLHGLHFLRRHLSKMRILSSNLPTVTP
jgi:hypothetical protein